MLYFSTWKTVLIWLVVAIGALVAAPNLYTQNIRDNLPSIFPSRTMTLGLDLQGGSHLLMQVDRKALVKDRLATLRDDARNIMRTEKIGYTDLAINGDREVTLKLTDVKDTEVAQEALSTLAINFLTIISSKYI